MRLEALQQSPEAFLGDYSEESRLTERYWRTTFANASWHMFFLDDSAPESQKIAGMAKSSIMSQFPDERYVESFWVHPKYRNQQVAGRLLDNIKREARGERRQVIRLSVLRSNEEAIKAFHSLGLSTTVPDRSSTAEICFELPLD
jgi:ribosomal protein S18 acetylase RimI-like enzyme